MEKFIEEKEYLENRIDCHESQLRRCRRSLEKLNGEVDTRNEILDELKHRLNLVKEAKCNTN